MATLTLPMRSPASEQTRSLLWSIAGHGVLVGLILLGGIVVHRTPPMVELGIKATVVDAKAFARRQEPAPEVPKPQPEARPPAEEQEQQRQKDLQQAEQQRQKEQAEAEQQKRQAAEARQAEAKRQAEEKRQADKAAAEQRAADRKAAEDKQREEAKKQADAAAKAASEQRRRQEATELRRQMAEEEKLLAAADSGALAQYVAVIRQRVERNWLRPPGAKAGLECEVFVTQIPGGQVTGVRMGNCNGDDAVRRSIEAAVLRASPLPQPDDPALFERNLRFTFKPEQ